MTAFNTMQRIKYLDGLFLTADLCNTEQSYYRNMMLYHNAGLFSSGLVCGLQVQNNKTTFSVSEGMAIDQNGNQLIWPSTSSASQMGIPSGATKFDIYIQYNEALDNNLISELPEINTTVPGTAPDPNLLLGSATVANGVITAIDVTKRVGIALKKFPYTAAFNQQTATKMLNGQATISTFDIEKDKPLKQSVYFLDSHEDAFIEIPQVNITVCTTDPNIYVATISEISRAGFIINVLLVNQDTGTKSPEPIKINWLAVQN